jgi:hypothetical protein
MHQSSESIGAIAAALAKAQTELTNPEKSLVATLPSPSGETERTFRYAPLSNGLEIVRKCLGRSVGLPLASVLAFLRLVTNPRVFEHPEPIGDAWRQASAWLACETVWIPQPTERHAELLGVAGHAWKSRTGRSSGCAGCRTWAYTLLHRRGFCAVSRFALG